MLTADTGERFCVPSSCRHVSIPGGIYNDMCAHSERCVAEKRRCHIQNARREHEGFTVDI